MRSPSKMQTIQIELTSACVLKCANCTRFCGTHKTPFFMEFDLFRRAVDSLVGYVQATDQLVGFMGGEPLLHPEFSEFCEYALTKIPRRNLGLWSTFPQKFGERYREVICKTFANVLLNDHARSDIMHGPILVGIEEVIKDERDMWRLIDDCWVQNTWSASINPKGAFFCEVAAAMSDLFDGSPGWEVEPGWWKRTPKDFGPQMEEFCRKCGCALPLKRRSSQDPRDDISPKNFERLQGISRKIDRGEYEISTFEMDQSLLKNNLYPDQVYKEFEYRRRIAAKYGIALTINEKGYMEPHLMDGEWRPKRPLFEILEEQYA